MLSAHQISRYWDDGFLSPIDIMSEGEAVAYRKRLEESEPDWAKIRDQVGFTGDSLVHVNFVLTLIDEVAFHPKLLDAVEGIIGPNVLMYGADIFLKEPHSEAYVSWHQDVRYWGLDPCSAVVTAWLALTPAMIANGCMRFYPGSFKGGILGHVDTFAKGNMLSRGQAVDSDIDEKRAFYAELAPGQASFHHGMTFHASAPNTTGGRRIGLAFRYLAPECRQTVAPKDFAQLARGRDDFGHFVLLDRIRSDYAPGAVANFLEVDKMRNLAMYQGAQRRTAG